MKKLLLLALTLLMALTLAVACTDEGKLPVDTVDTEASTEAHADTKTECEILTDTPAEAPTEILTEKLTEMLTEVPTETPTKDSTEVPTDTSPVTEETADAPENGETTTEEKEPLTDIHDVMAAIITNNDMDKLENYRISTALDLELAVSMFGFTTKMNLTGGMSFTMQSADAMRLEMEIPTQAPYSLTYVEDVLYVVSADGKYKCPLDNGAIEELWPEISGGLFPSEDENPSEGLVDDKSLMGLLSALLEAMDVTALFGDTQVTVDPATGKTFVTLHGLSPKAQEAIQGLFDAAEQGTSTLPNDENNAAGVDILVSLLKSVDMSEMTLTLIADKDMLLEGYALKAPVDMSGLSDLFGDVELIPGMGAGTQMPMDATLTLSSTILRGGQTVSVPEDAHAYEETDFDTLFGRMTEEESGNGVQAVG